MERHAVSKPRHLTTEIEQTDDRARFVIATPDPLYQDRLEHLGYLGIGDARFATAWFPRSPGVAAYYERFAASIEEMAVRGLDIEPGDIDINVSNSSLAGRIFDDLLVTPVLELQGWAAKHTGRAFYKAIVEWLSEPRAESDDRSARHEQGPFVADQLEAVQWRDHLIYVPPLSAQLRICERRGLDDRAKLIRSAMRR